MLVNVPLLRQTVWAGSEAELSGTWRLRSSKTEKGQGQVSHQEHCPSDPYLPKFRVPTIMPSNHDSISRLD